MIDKLKSNMVAILCIVIFTGFVVFVGIKIAPIKILRNWELNVDQTSYHPGDTIHLTSTSTKLRKAGGVSERVVECHTKQDSSVGYSINQTEAKRPPGSRATEYDIIIPTNVTDLPVTCKVIVTVKYSIYWGLRVIPEHAYSNEFIIK